MKKYKILIPAAIICCILAGCAHDPLQDNEMQGGEESSQHVAVEFQQEIILHPESDKVRVDFSIGSDHSTFDAGLVAFVNGIPQLLEQGDDKNYVFPVICTDSEESQFETSMKPVVALESEKYNLRVCTMLHPTEVYSDDPGYYIGFNQALSGGYLDENKAEPSSVKIVPMKIVDLQAANQKESSAQFEIGSVFSKDDYTVMDRAYFLSGQYGFHIVTEDQPVQYIVSVWGDLKPMTTAGNDYYRITQPAWCQADYYIPIEQEDISNITNFALVACPEDDNSALNAYKTSTIIFSDKINRLDMEQQESGDAQQGEDEQDDLDGYTYAGLDEQNNPVVYHYIHHENGDDWYVNVSVRSIDITNGETIKETVFEKEKVCSFETIPGGFYISRGRDISIIDNQLNRLYDGDFYTYTKEESDRPAMVSDGCVYWIATDKEGNSRIQAANIDTGEVNTIAESKNIKGIFSDDQFLIYTQSSETANIQTIITDKTTNEERVVDGYQPLMMYGSKLLLRGKGGDDLSLKELYQVYDINSEETVNYDFNGIDTTSVCLIGDTGKIACILEGSNEVVLPDAPTNSTQVIYEGDMQVPTLCYSADELLVFDYGSYNRIELDDFFD